MYQTMLRALIGQRVVAEVEIKCSDSFEAASAEKVAVLAQLPKHPWDMTNSTVRAFVKLCEIQFSETACYDVLVRLP